MSVGIDFTKSELAVGDESNLAPGLGRNQPDVTQVIAKCSCDRNAADCRHLGERVDQSSVLALFERIDQNLFIFRRRELVDGHLHVKRLSQLGAGTPSGGVDRLDFPVISR